MHRGLFSISSWCFILVEEVSSIGGSSGGLVEGRKVSTGWSCRTQQLSPKASLVEICCKVVVVCVDAGEGGKWVLVYLLPVSLYEVSDFLPIDAKSVTTKGGGEGGD